MTPDTAAVNKHVPNPELVVVYRSCWVNGAMRGVALNRSEGEREGVKRNIVTQNSYQCHRTHTNARAKARHTQSLAHTLAPTVNLLEHQRVGVPVGSPCPI